MKTKTPVEISDTQWLREYASQNKLTAMMLMPQLRNVKYTTIYRWIALGGEATVREHRRAVAAFRRRMERPS